MSRYLSQLTRETRSSLKPPSRFGWAPRMEAFQEIHEERLVPAAPGPVATPRAEHAAPADAVVVAREPEVSHTIAPLVTQSAPNEPAASQAVAPRLPGSAPLQPVEAAPRPREAASETAPTERQIRLPQVAPPPAGPPQEIHAVAFLEEDGLAGMPASTQWTPAPPSPPRSVPPAGREAARLLHPAPQPVVDVTIGKIEVTIEGERQAPPLRITRPPEPRVPPKRVDTPRRAGRLARLYLDR